MPTQARALPGKARQDPSREAKGKPQGKQDHDQRFMTNSTVSSGVTSSGITASSGDTWSIYGAAVSFTVISGGTETVFRRRAASPP